MGATGAGIGVVAGGRFNRRGASAGLAWLANGSALMATRSADVAGMAWRNVAVPTGTCSCAVLLLAISMGAFALTGGGDHRGGCSAVSLVVAAWFACWRLVPSPFGRRDSLAGASMRCWSMAGTTGMGEGGGGSAGVATGAAVVVAAVATGLTVFETGSAGGWLALGSSRMCQARPAASTRVAAVLMAIGQRGRRGCNGRTAAAAARNTAASSSVLGSLSGSLRYSAASSSSPGRRSSSWVFMGLASFAQPLAQPIHRIAQARFHRLASGTGYLGHLLQAHFVFQP